MLNKNKPWQIISQILTSLLSQIHALRVGTQPFLHKFFKSPALNWTKLLKQAAARTQSLANSAGTLPSKSLSTGLSYALRLLLDGRCMLLSTDDNRRFLPEAGCIGLSGWMRAGHAQRSRLSRGGGLNWRSDVLLKWKSLNQEPSNKGELKNAKIVFWRSFTLAGDLRHSNMCSQEQK